MFKQYEGLLDEQIIKMIHENDERAMNYLLNKYKNMVRQKARTMFLIGGDKDDLIQEGMIGLYRAIRAFRPEKESSFYSFAELCVNRQMYTAIKVSNRKKNIPLNTYISLYAPAYRETGEEDEIPSLVDILPPNFILNPEELVIDKESATVIEYELERSLSSFEKDVLDLYLDGFKYVQIAGQLEKEPKSIDNALQRIKAKLSRILEEIK